MAAGKQKLVFRASLLALIINAALNYFLIPRYGMVMGGITLMMSECILLFILVINLLIRKS
jgi:O-antigen/teichoic acid export membrane protein